MVEPKKFVFGCRQFATQAASGVQAFPRVVFWIHWLICPFCRRYWKELREIASLQKMLSSMESHPIVNISDVKERLKEKLLKESA